MPLQALRQDSAAYHPNPGGRHTLFISLRDARQLFGLTARALHFYEQIGLIEAGRDRLNCRYYDDVARRRLEWIAKLRPAGVPLAEIANILRADDDVDRMRSLALAALHRRQRALEIEFASLEQAMTTLPPSQTHATGRRA